MRFLKKFKYLITVIIVITIIIAIIIMKKNLNNTSYNELEANIPNQIKTEKISKIYVDIKGEVNKKGVYEATDDMIVQNIIDLAGGLTKNADTSVINLSKKVTDEMVIIVYSKDQVKNSNIVNNVVKIVEKECKCPNIQNDSCINEEITDSINNYQSDSLVTSKISLKTMTKEQLLTIPGIGETKADAIIEYKKKNGFSKIEDLLNVSGIGESTYEKIKEYFIL